MEWLDTNVTNPCITFDKPQLMIYGEVFLNDI